MMAGDNQRDRNSPENAQKLSLENSRYRGLEVVCRGDIFWSNSDELNIANKPDHETGDDSNTIHTVISYSHEVSCTSLPAHVIAPRWTIMDEVNA